MGAISEDLRSWIPDIPVTPLAFTKFLHRALEGSLHQSNWAGHQSAWAPVAPPAPPARPHGSHGGPCQAKVGSTTASRTLSIYASAVEGSGPKSRKMPEELDELDVALPSCQGKGKEKRKKKTALAALARLKAVANVGDST